MTFPQSIKKSKIAKNLKFLIAFFKKLCGKPKKTPTAYNTFSTSVSK